MSKRRILLLIICGLIAGIGLAVIRGQRPERVEAVGDLLITYLGVPIGGPIFKLDDIKPGDCMEREIVVYNGGKLSELLTVKGVRKGGTDVTPPLEGILSFEIKNGGSFLYGGNPGKSVASFFQDSLAGWKLLLVKPNETQKFQFRSCFPIDSGNEYQTQSVVFDLIFRTEASDHIVINEVYYHVDGGHGVDCPKDRGIFVEANNQVSLIIKNNATGSANTISVSQDQACKILQANQTNSSANVNQTGTTGGNSLGGNTSSILSMITRTATNMTRIFNRGGDNYAASCNCGCQLGRCDEWIELYNPTDQTVNLKDWTLTDNSGITVKITGNRNLGPKKFALLSKDNSTWAHWNEPGSVLKIPLGRQIGDGLDNSGDKIILKNKNGALIDALSYGDDISVFTLAGVVEGHSLERKITGIDTDTPSDWFEQFLPSPGT